jgi:DNA-binding transcriptional regulator YhcF (GntR family)
VSAQPDSTRSEQRRLSELAAAIDRDADVPIGLQLGWALSARIHDGELRPGQRLPGLRELAQESGLNVNTVRAVYQRLEQRGLLESQQGSGTFVASTFRRPSAVGAIAADAAREAEAIGVDPREVAAALYVAMPREDAATAAAPPPPPSSPPPAAAAAAAATTTTAGESTDGPSEEASAAGAVAHRRALRAQIATLERAIGEIEAEHPGVAPRPSATRRGPGPTLLSAQELEQVRSTLVRRLAQVQSAIDERAAGGAAERAVDTQKGRQRARARVNARKDNTPVPGGDPPPTPTTTSPTSPGRTARPRTAPPRPAAAGT